MNIIKCQQKKDNTQKIKIHNNSQNFNQENKQLKINLQEKNNKDTESNINEEQNYIDINNLTVSLEKLQKSSLTKTQKLQYLNNIRNSTNQKWYQLLFKTIKLQNLSFIQKYKIEYIDLFQYNWSTGRRDDLFTKCPRQLVSIYLPNLLILNLSYQKIDNIQSLTFINSPNLKQLYLLKNNITNINPFVKSNFPKLTKIILYSNPINLTENFYRMNSQQQIHYELDSTSQKDYLIWDLRFLFKIKIEAVNQISLMNCDRLKFRIHSILQKLKQTGKSKIKMINVNEKN